MTLLRAWLWLSLFLVVGWLIWTFAPILVPVLLVTGGLGVLVAAIVTGARRLEKRRGPPLG